MAYRDIRNWLTDVERYGELKYISGADCDLEMSSICELVYREGNRPAPALLFDDIPDYPKGYRTLFGILSSPRRLTSALYLSLSEDQMKPLDIVQSWRRKMRDLRPIPPKFVDFGSVQENSFNEDKVDLCKFPSPKFHELDGGRYIGTAHAVILNDPDNGWVNLGTYRCMLVDHNRLALHITEKKHGSIISHDRYFSREQIMPVAIAIGLDPTLWLASAQAVASWQTSEYDYVGGIRGEPIEVITGPYTGLPVPAHAEIVIEGECNPGDLIDEGPFGEWTGYYGNLGLSTVPEPIIRVKTLLHRHDPILTCAHMSVPPSDTSLWACISRSATIWEKLEGLGIPGIRAVWNHEAGGSRLFNVISIKQMYAGHSREVGLIASQLMNLNKYTVVVDEDIDPSNLDEVVWAIATRGDPERSIHILPHQGSGSPDPTISPADKRKIPIAPKPLYSSRALIDACQPYEWKAEWYPTARVSSELRLRVMKKWESLLKELGCER